MLKSSGRHRTGAALFLAIVSAAAIACAGDSSSGPVASPLAGLAETSRNDTSGSQPPPNAPPSDTVNNPPDGSPGIIRGTVRGQAEVGSGPDSLEAMPRIPNVTVTAYDRAPSAPNDVVAGTQRASVVTDANGEFELPELPGGVYVVTFVPPASSLYRGVYSFGPVNSQTSLYSWFVVLPKK